MCGLYYVVIVVVVVRRQTLVTHTFIYKWNGPACPVPQPQQVAAFWLILILISCPT